MKISCLSSCQLGLSEHVVPIFHTFSTFCWQKKMFPWQNLPSSLSSTMAWSAHQQGNIGPMKKLKWLTALNQSWLSLKTEHTVYTPSKSQVFRSCIFGNVWPYVGVDAVWKICSPDSQHGWTKNTTYWKPAYSLKLLDCLMEKHLKETDRKDNRLDFAIH